MTGNQITALRYDVNLIGQLLIDKDGKLIIEAVELGTKNQEEALRVIARSWNELQALFDEVSSLAEDHAKMTHTLHQINEKAVDAIQGTAKSQIAEDWWQAAG